MITYCNICDEPVKDHCPNCNKQYWKQFAKSRLSEGTNMPKLNEAAQAYEPQRTRNISELDKVPVDVEVKEETHKKRKTGEEFTIKVIEVEGETYRVPNSVLESLKALLEKLPNTKFITVLKTGDGMNSRYQVLPWQDSQQNA